MVLPSCMGVFTAAALTLLCEVEGEDVASGGPLLSELETPLVQAPDEFGDLQDSEPEALGWPFFFFRRFLFRLFWAARIS